MDRPNASRASTQLDRLPCAPWPSKMTNVSILPPHGLQKWIDRMPPGRARSSTDCPAPLGLQK